MLQLFKFANTMLGKRKVCRRDMGLSMAATVALVLVMSVSVLWLLSSGDLEAHLQLSLMYLRHDVDYRVTC